MNNIYQHTTEKTWTTPLLLENPKNKNFQPTDLERDFFNRLWCRINYYLHIKNLHPKLAQGASLMNYGKLQLFLIPTRAMEQNKLSHKPFKQIFHITEIKQNIVGTLFITK